MSSIDSIRSIDVYNNNSTSRIINNTVYTEEIDLDVIEAYNEEINKNKSIFESASELFNNAKAKLDSYKASAADVSSNVESAVNKKSMADLTKSALDQLENNSGIIVIKNDVINKPESLEIQIEKDDSNKEQDLRNGYISIEAITETPGDKRGNVSGPISPGTNPTTNPGKKYTLDENTMKDLIATVYSEANEGDYIISDTMGVTSVILNRCEKQSSEFGFTVGEVIRNEGAFEGTTKDKYDAAIEGRANIKPQMIEAINRVLNGERNTNALFFGGHGDYNIFREEY